MQSDQLQRDANRTGEIQKPFHTVKSRPIFAKNVLCRLSSLTSVPYKQFSWGKTIIIPYFHQDGQLTDIFTP